MTNPRLVAALVVGSIAVHVLVSCASSAIHSTASNSDAGSVGVGTPETGASDTGSFLDALADVATFIDGASTPDASASPTPPTSITATCEPAPGDAGATYWFATAAVPGRTMTSLAGTLAINCTDLTTLPSEYAAGFPPGFSCVVATVWLADGQVAAGCGYSSIAGVKETITFLVPAP
jgi:hypothetical protein